MTTVADFGQYTGINGSLEIDGVPFLDVQYSVQWSTDDVTYSRGNKRSDGAIPGKRKVQTKIHKVFVREEAATLLGYSVSDTPMTGTAGTIQSANTFTADTVETIASNPATPSRIKVVTGTAAITTAGRVIVYGTDVGDRPMTEIFDIPDDTVAGTEFEGTKVFKTATHYAIMDLVGDSGCTLAIQTMAGSTTLVFGDPKIFDLVGKLTKGAHVITITQQDCWFRNGGISWTDSGKVIEVDADVSMHDPDLLSIDIT